MDNDAPALLSCRVRAEREDPREDPMSQYEYRVIVAPDRPRKLRGVSGKDRFAGTLSAVMNEMAAEGWEFQRAERLPVEERRGLFGKSVSEQNLLVFRRSAPATESPEAAEDAATPEPRARREGPIPFNAAFRRITPARNAPPLTAVGESRDNDRPGD